MESTLANRTKEAAERSDRYGRLITINVRHGFYNPPGSDADGPCPDLVIAPTPDTIARLARFGLLVRRRPDGIDILSGARQSAMLGAVAAASPGGLSFETARRLFGPPLLFTLRLANPQFLNITQMAAGFGTGSRALLLSNMRTRPADGGATEVEIDWDDFLTPVGPKPPSADDRPNAAHPEDSIERKAIRVDRLGLPFATLDIHVVSPAGEDGRPIPGAFPVDPGLPPPSAGAQAGSNDGYLRPVVYDLRFEARRTRWRYVIADRHGRLDGPSLTVVDPGRPAVGFTVEPDAPSVPGAARCFAFLSEAALPLRQRPSTRFALSGAVIGGRRGARPLVDPLPAPDPTMLARRTSAPGRDGTADLSEIHVFV